ncbi:MAG: hypothetical protein KIT84_33940 [Labilithrix sp.]|nr:hypothetical protein [Labilithrix sp.]MCW5816049.1 hypothetical protein [Labilithrix sp.]
MKLRSVAVVSLLLLSSARALADDKPVKPEREEKESFRLGPIVGVGFPRPLAVEGFVKVRRTVGLGLEYSFLPRTTIAGASTRFDAVALDARWFPFEGGFFVGLRGGRQWLSGSATLRVQDVGSFTESADVATWFVNPRVGFLYTWSSGVTLGIDAGIQLPIAPTFERSGPATAAGVASREVDETLRTIANTFGNDVTPTLDLFRLGFLF